MDKLIDKMINEDNPLGRNATVEKSVDVTVEEPVIQGLDVDQKIVNDTLGYNPIGSFKEDISAAVLPITYGEDRLGIIGKSLENITGIGTPAFTESGSPIPSIGKNQANFILNSSLNDLWVEETPESLEKTMHLSELINRSSTDNFAESFSMNDVDVNKDTRFTKSNGMVVDTWKPTSEEWRMHEKLKEDAWNIYIESTGDTYDNFLSSFKDMKSRLAADTSRGKYLDDRKERSQKWFEDNLYKENNKLFDMMAGEGTYYNRMKELGFWIPVSLEKLDKFTNDKLGVEGDLEDNWEEKDYNTLFNNLPGSVETRYDLWFVGMGLESPFKNSVSKTSYTPSQIQNDLKGLEGAVTGFDKISGHKGHFKAGDRIVGLAGSSLKRVEDFLSNELSRKENLGTTSDVNLGDDVMGGAVVGHKIDPDTGEEYVFVYDLWDLKALDKGPISPQDIAGFEPPQIYERFYVHRNKDGSFKNLERRNSKESANTDKAYNVGQSNIQGKGVFAEHNMVEGQKLGTAMITEPVITTENDIERTDLGKNINHQINKNVTQVREGDNYIMYVDRDIEQGEELTMDYRDTPWFIDKNIEGFKELE